MANCDRSDCDGQGIWMPVLQLTVKGYRGPPVQIAFSLRICDPCKRTLTVDDLVTDDGWAIFCAQLRAAGRAKPTRKLTKIAWQRIPDPQDN